MPFITNALRYHSYKTFIFRLIIQTASKREVWKKCQHKFVSSKKGIFKTKIWFLVTLCPIEAGNSAMWRSLLTHLWQCNIRDLILTLWAYETALVFIKDNLGCGSVTCVKSELHVWNGVQWYQAFQGNSIITFWTYYFDSRLFNKNILEC